MAENPKIKKIKLGENTYDLDLGYKNEKGQARYTVGGLPQGFDFSKEMSVKQIFDKIFFPYTQMTVEDAVLSPASGTYSIPNYQTLTTVTVPVTKNDTVGLEFYLYDTTTSPRRLVKGPLTEEDIDQNSELIFNNLAEEAIKTPKTYQVVYTYLYEDGVTRSEEENLGSYTFNLTFNVPSTPTVVVKDASGSAVSSDYKVGQSCTVGKITATVANLNSAVGDNRAQGINEFVLSESHNPSFNQIVNSNTDKKSCEFTLAAVETLAPTYNDFTSGSRSYTYKVVGKYNKREVNSESWTENGGTTSQGSDTITFTFDDASISLSGVATQTKSKLDPLDVSNLKATVTKNSDKVNSVDLFVNSVNTETIDCTSDAECIKTNYDSTGREKTFTYSNSICSTATFQAKANCISGTKTSSSKTVTFKAPYCWGWVGSGISLSSFNNYEDLKALATKKITLSSTECSNRTVTIKTGDPTGQQKFVFACPKSENAPFSGFNSFTNVADAANFPCFDSFDGNTAADRLVDITFEDGSAVTYQIFVTSSVNGAGTTYKFS